MRTVIAVCTYVLVHTWIGIDLWKQCIRKKLHIKIIRIHLSIKKTVCYVTIFFYIIAMCICVFLCVCVHVCSSNEIHLKTQKMKRIKVSAMKCKKVFKIPLQFFIKLFLCDNLCMSLKWVSNILNWIIFWMMEFMKSI